MVHLLDCLKRRENWPEQFISALEACEHPTIAAEIQAEYNALRGINNPSAPATPVVRAHVHPAPPSPGPVPNPGSAVIPQAAPAPPVVVAPEPLPPSETPPQSTTLAPVLEASTPPEPPQAQVEVVVPPATPPPSPETPRGWASATPLPQAEYNIHQEPEENSESELQVQDVPDETLNVDQVKVPAAPEPPEPGEPCETDAPSLTNPDAPELTLTPEKPPVQDTTPPVDKVPAVVLEPEETSIPSDAQVVKIVQQIEVASSPPVVFGNNDSMYNEDSIASEDDVCFSKPGQLVSVQPQNHECPTICPEPEPYSGNSERLEMSEAERSAQTCQENGIDHRKPEENHYESPAPSLNMEDVRENVGRVAEEPSILNLGGQTMTPFFQVSGEPAKEITPAPYAPATTLILSPSSRKNHHPNEPLTDPKLPDSGEKAASCRLTANTKYILTAVGVCACALLMAWKFKH